MYMMLDLNFCAECSQNGGERGQIKPFDAKFVATILPESIIVGNFPIELNTAGSWVIDSRKVEPGAFFVAIKGMKTDGHLFIAQAIERGARLVLMDVANRAELDKLSPIARAKTCFILVSVPEIALVQLARAWRAQFSIPVVGVTGSVGKTTTKELIAAMVRLGGKSCLVSSGNYNTALGAAITLLGLRPGHDCAVLEMGISERGEMVRLADLIRPTLGVITTVAHQHLDGLGSLPDIAAEKRAIFTHFQPDFIGIINGDQALLSNVSYSHPVVRFGYKLTNQVQARRLVLEGGQLTCLLKVYGERFQLTLPTPHKGFLLSALAAAAAAHFLEISPASIVAAIETMAPVRGRFNVIPLKRFAGVVIDDAYNASPESVKEALIAFEQLALNGRKIAILGDMLALGEQSAFWHRQIGRFLRKTPHIERVVLVGEQMREAEKTMPRWVTYQTVPRWEDAQSIVEAILAKEESALLVKGSHDIGLHQLVTNLIG